MAVTNFFKMRKVILNDRWRKCYKPDRSTVEKIGILLPDASIFGFGFEPQLGFWVMLVECARFPDNPYGVIREICINDLSTFNKTPPLAIAKAETTGWFW